MLLQHLLYCSPHDKRIQNPIQKVERDAVGVEVKWLEVRILIIVLWGKG
jgi:hypothetical protein